MIVKLRIMAASGVFLLCVVACSAQDGPGAVPAGAAHTPGTAVHTASAHSAAPKQPSGHTSNAGSGKLSKKGKSPVSDPSADPKRVRCAVTTKQTQIFRRNWDRVTASAGRGDQRKFTKPFVGQVKALEKAGAKCPGNQNLAAMRTAATMIDTSAAQGDVAYDAIRSFATAGSRWLDALGYGPDLLSTS